MLQEKVDVIQSNTLIFAKHKLSLHALRFVIVAASKLSRDDKEFQEHEITIREMCAVLGIANGAHLYKALDKATDEILQTIIRVDNEEGPKKYTLAASAQYIKKTGIIRFSFHPDMTELLLELKENFTRYDLRNVIFLPTAYSIKLFEILKSKEYRRYWECSLEELKEILGVEEGMYKIYGNFNSRVLRPSVLSINENTDIKVEYEEIKTGRKVTGIGFYINSQKVDRSEKNLILEVLGGAISKAVDGETLKRLQEYGLSKKQAEEIMIEHNGEYVIENLDEIDKRRKTQDIKNIGAYTIAAIKDDYAQSTREEKQGREEQKQVKTQQAQQAQEQEEQEAELHRRYIEAIYAEIQKTVTDEKYEEEAQSYLEQVNDFTKKLIAKNNLVTGDYATSPYTKNNFAKYLAEKHLLEEWHSVEDWQASQEL